MNEHDEEHLEEEFDEDEWKFERFFAGEENAKHFPIHLHVTVPSGARYTVKLKSLTTSGFSVEDVYGVEKHPLSPATALALRTVLLTLLRRHLKGEPLLPPQRKNGKEKGDETQ